MSEDFKNLSKYRDILWNGLKDMEEVYINGALIIHFQEFLICHLTLLKASL